MIHLQDAKSSFIFTIGRMNPTFYEFLGETSERSVYPKLWPLPATQRFTLKRTGARLSHIRDCALRAVQRPASRPCRATSTPVSGHPRRIELWSVLHWQNYPAASSALGAPSLRLPASDLQNLPDNHTHMRGVSYPPDALPNQPASRIT